MRDVIEKLKGALSPEQIFEQEPMSQHTTFKVGGCADVLVEPCSVEQVQSVVNICREAAVKLYVIGEGSNLLVSDSGLRGVVMHLGSAFSDIAIDGCALTCQAGATNEQVAAEALAAGLAGYEFASGIPGSIGGAAYMNAGAYDGEFKDVARSVVCIAKDGSLCTLDAADAGFSYRYSRMMDEGLIVVEVSIELREDDAAAIKARMDDLRQRRENKQPLEKASAGSTFKRPEGYFAGKLIQDAGMQGHSVGDAQVSPKHAGFVVNNGSATAEDVLGVISDVQEAVFKMEGVLLEPEVRMWGFE